MDRKDLINRIGAIDVIDGDTLASLEHPGLGG